MESSTECFKASTRVKVRTCRPLSRPQVGTKATKQPAKDIVTSYYTAYNDKNMDQVLSLFSDDVVYEDLIYEEPFRGKEEVCCLCDNSCV